MKILLFILFTLSFSALADDACQELAYDQISSIEDKGLELEHETLQYIQDDLYFNCKLGLDSESSWVCVDKSFASFLKFNMPAIHFNTRLRVWYESGLTTFITPDIQIYSEPKEPSDQDQFTHYNLSGNYRIMIQNFSSNRYKLNGIKIKSNASYNRRFVNMSCYDVNALLSP